MRRRLAGLLGAGLFFLASREARAAARDGGAGAAWGLLTLQIVGGAEVLWVTQTNPSWVNSSSGPLILSGVTFGAAIGGGVLAYYLGADPRSAHVASGVLWGAFPGLLAGSLWDGGGRSLKPGVKAISLGVVGAAAGGALGALVIDRQEVQIPWLAAPSLGAAFGTLVGGLGAFVSNADNAEAWFVTGTAAGALLGLGLSAPFSRSSSGAKGTTATQQAPLSLAVQGSF